MNLIHYRDLIAKAVKDDGSALDLIAARLADAAQAKQMLHAKGYGSAWCSITAMAAEVLPARSK